MGVMDWIDLSQDKDRWRAFVYTVMNLRVPWNAGNFLSSLGRFSFSEGLCPMELVMILWIQLDENNV
jgi:hypothetical protein